VQSDGVVMLVRAFNKHLRLLQFAEDLTDEQLIARRCQSNANQSPFVAKWPIFSAANYCYSPSAELEA
jgi:hypothetical protein